MMTTDYMLNQILLHGEKMRSLQKAFFLEKDGDKRKDLLKQSKKAEQEFDNLVFNLKQLRG